MKNDPPCPHARLTPGSGGYYIFCMDCHHTWSCEQHHHEDGPCKTEFRCATVPQMGGGHWEWIEPLNYQLIEHVL